MFSWTIALMNICFVLCGGGIAILEGRFSHNQLGPRSIPWTCHGGNWADLILISAIAGFVWPYGEQWAAQTIYRCAVVSGIVSITCHIAWAFMQTIPGSIVDPVVRFRLPLGGWYHLMYMWLTFTWILLFFLYTPGANRLPVCLLLSIFVVPAIMQPGWYSAKIVEGKGHIDAAGWCISIAMWILIWFGYTIP